MKKRPLNHGNLLTPLPQVGADEMVEALVQVAGLRIERIVSTGQASPSGFWYDQADDEFVVLLAGSAVLRFQEGDRHFDLRPGDWMEIPAHVRHRVEATQSDPPTVWLAVHYRDPGRGRARAVGSATSGSSGQ